jgi:hypothetical protein
MWWRKINAVPAEMTKRTGHRMSQIVVTAIVAAKNDSLHLGPLRFGWLLRPVFPEASEHGYRQFEYRLHFRSPKRPVTMFHG